ncbi:uncharacterized protein [Hemitrygon akajei]|uniref:uncharacterized protein isoform X2 n=1 Tax=Hemitrygon akajei TaxID=2704970 RepID=UPI003BF9413D
MPADLKDGDCSLVIDNITLEDAGPYFFRIEFGGQDNFNYQSTTLLSVSDFIDKPTIFAAELVEGKSVNIKCVFNTTCDGTSPTLTWVTPTDVPPSVSSSVTRWHNTLTYTSVLTMTPALKHHGQNLTCRVRYPSVSSEQTLSLTVQSAVSKEWRADTPSQVISQRGLCARIPCHYHYPSRLDKKSRTGIWYNADIAQNPQIAFHSNDHSRENLKFRYRTRMPADLKDGDCSLVIDNITLEDAGPYFFRIEFGRKDNFNYQSTTLLSVSDFTDKPTIFAAELVEGKSVNIKCVFNTTCDGTSPTLTWVTPTDVPPSVSSSVTRWHNTLTYTSVLTMTPALKHHGQNLTCRVRYPSVSSEQTLSLTVQSAVSKEWRADTPSQVISQRGLCARIPCHYHYPSRLDKKSRTGIWYNADIAQNPQIAFHSIDHRRENLKFRYRTRMPADLKDGDCSLVIDNITLEDAGPYFFRIEFGRKDNFNYQSTTLLSVSDFIDKPTIFAAELVEGKSVNIKCVFNTTCDGTSPTLTWVTPTDVPPSVSSSVTRWHKTLTYTSVLTMTPALKHHGQNLTCRVRYPSVSSEQTLSLTVQSAVSKEWRADTPSQVISQRGLCARIPCHYHYPSRLDKKSRTGIWYNADIAQNPQIAFHSIDHSRENLKFRYRTRMPADLKDGDCSLVIDNITLEDAGPYFFRIEFGGKDNFNYQSTTLLSVSDFTDKPTIFAAELVEGKSVNIKCVFNTTCDGTSPTLTWVTPTDVPPSVSSSVTRWHNTLTYTSVLTMTPALKHHGQNLTCRVRYPSVSSEQTITLTVQSAVSKEWRADTPSQVTSQRGLCAWIPCHYHYPSRLDKKSRTGIWYNADIAQNPQIAFHSIDHSRENLKFRYRTRMPADLKDGDCSLVIDNITLEDAGPYFFRIEFGGKDNFNYQSTTLLSVSDFTDKPTIFAAEIVEGKSVNITCIFNTTCDGTSPTLTWVTPMDVPPSVSSSVTQWHNNLTYTSVLTMTPALKHHGQNLICRVRYPSVSSEQSLTLTVQYAPQNFSITSTNSVNNSWVNMKEGIPTSILCSVQSFPASNLRWRHLGVTLNTTSSSNKLWLVFPQVTPQQAGDYQCVAENKHGTAERTVTLTVEYTPQNLSITSTNSVNNSWVNMKEGIPTSILCSVQSFPASNLRWRHLGVTLNTTSSSNKLWLVFPQVTPQQAGDYQCVAENKHGTAERTVTLTVEYTPQNFSITSTNSVNNSWVNMKEGIPTSILCSVQSFPASNLRWRHLGVTLNTTSSSNKLWLVFPQVTPQQAGVYQCVAENKHGTAERAVTLTVEYAPQNLSITSTNSVNNSWVNMKEGIPTSILCSVQSFPASNLTWRHLGVTLNTTSSSNELWLEFPQVTPQQAGVYQCVAENEHGTAERAITLSVEYAPQNLSVTSPNNVNNSWVNIKEGIPTSILCSVQSFPVSNLTWRHLGVTLNTSSSNELWLEFPQVTPQQAGVYQCVAENEHGTAERAITLSVEYKPEISRDSGCTRTPEVITCVCAARSNPPGELTWHLPLASLSGNQTHGHFQTWQVADGQLVTGSLTLGVDEGEENVTAFCTVRNQHGEVMFAVSLWIKGRVSTVWITVLLTSSVILSMLLAGFFISRYIPKRDAQTKETALEILDSTVSSTAHLTAPQDTERQTTSQIPLEVSPVMPVGEGEECGPVYASLRELPSSGGPVRRGETVIYAELHFQSIEAP